MLIENKFYYVSLPRCASTAFMASCVKMNLKIQHLDSDLDVQNQLITKKLDYDEINYNDFAHQLSHGHEPINSLIKKFGNKYDIISVNRNKYDRFISLWNHILNEMDIFEKPHIFQICKQLTIDDILFYDKNDVNDTIIYDALEKLADRFIEKNKLFGISDYGKRILQIFFRPYSAYHNHNKNIIWFDYERLNELEDWVSKKLNLKFELLRINSSKHYTGGLSLTDEFKLKYDSIYQSYDELKLNKTII